ncbi:MAG TPA: hypothetical protein VM184_07915 [Gaiellaceae bacterium]|nr:hypothetical protein [Gaiellaceae bacterium]
MRTFAPVTAFCFSWIVPTLFRGSAFTAAMLVPPSATKSATAAATSAGGAELYAGATDFLDPS